MKKIEDGSSYFNLDPINFKSYLDHCLDTKKNLYFPIYLLLCALTEECTL